MKNIKYLLFVLTMSTVLFSCEDSIDEVHDELGSVSTSIRTDIKYTLTDEDYEDMGVSSGVFMSFEEAEEKIPVILNEQLVNSEGAKAILNINILNNFNIKNDNLVNIQEVVLEKEDYPTDKSEAFLPSEDALTLLPAIVKAKVSSPTEGQFVSVNYKNYTAEPTSGSQVVTTVNFSTFQGWTPINVVGNQEWSEGNQFNNVEMSGFNGSSVENEDWLISPEIDLTGKSKSKISIEQNYNFGSDLSNLKVLVSKDYTGNQTTATWKEVTFTVLPTGNDNNYVTSEKVEISEFDGEKINIALKYNSTNSDNYRWRVRKIEISEGEDGDLEGPTEDKNIVYTYNGSAWEEPSNFYVLTTEDYDSMGTESGQPGRFNNFSSSVPAEDYLPTFLTRTYPFAQSGDEQIISYKFFSGGIETRYSIYTFENNGWSIPSGVTSTEIRFKFKGNAWVSDNATRYTFTSADYDKVVEELTSDTDLSDEVGNLDRFGNFNRGTGATGWDDTEILKAFNIVLKNNFPDAETGDAFLVTVTIYNGSTVTAEFSLVLEAGGDYAFVVE